MLRRTGEEAFMSIAPQPPTLRGATVLVVEDEFYLAMEIKEEIERVGGAVIGPYASAQDGLAGLAAAKPDYGLVDINLGEGPTYEVADALQSRGVPFAFLTGYDAGSSPERFSLVERVEKPTHHRKVLEVLDGLRTG
jgi:CheY-like chemotaxis protein